VRTMIVVPLLRTAITVAGARPTSTSSRSPGALVVSGVAP
jgi:hypothetical protein